MNVSFFVHTRRYRDSIRVASINDKPTLPIIFHVHVRKNHHL
jgi:hypothetical protein